MNLSANDKKFIDHYEKIKGKKNNIQILLLKGFRNSLLFVSLIILSITTGWYKRMKLFSLGQLIFLSIGLVLIILFSTVLYAYYHQELLEQRYKELTQKKSSKKK